MDQCESGRANTPSRIILGAAHGVQGNRRLSRSRFRYGAQARFCRRPRGVARGEAGRSRRLFRRGLSRLMARSRRRPRRSLRRGDPGEGGAGRLSRRRARRGEGAHAAVPPGRSPRRAAAGRRSAGDHRSRNSGGRAPVVGRARPDLSFPMAAAAGRRERHHRLEGEPRGDARRSRCDAAVEAGETRDRLHLRSRNRRLRPRARPAGRSSARAWGRARALAPGPTAAN